MEIQAGNVLQVPVSGEAAVVHSQENLMKALKKTLVQLLCFLSKVICMTGTSYSLITNPNLLTAIFFIVMVVFISQSFKTHAVPDTEDECFDNIG